MDGTYTERRYSCRGVDWERSRDGSVTTYQHDDQQRLLSTTDEATGITTRYEQGPNGYH